LGVISAAKVWNPSLSQFSIYTSWINLAFPYFYLCELGVLAENVSERASTTLKATVTCESCQTPWDTNPKSLKPYQNMRFDEPSEIGEGTKIWHFSHVLKDSLIGRNCNIGQNVVIGPRVSIGDDCKIQNNVSVYEGVTLEDNVFCGPSIVFTNVINPRCEVDRHGEFKKTLVRRDATIGANSKILCGLTIGRSAFIGAGNVVTKDVPDFALVMGNPSRQTGHMCSCGIKLPNGPWETATCEDCGHAYTMTDGIVAAKAGD